MIDFHLPAMLPDDRGLLVAAHKTAFAADEIVVITDDGQRTLVHHPGEWLHYPVYAPSGHLIYQRGTSQPELWATRFSLEERSTAGSPFRVAAPGRGPSVSHDGTLVYLSGGVEKQLVWVDLEGNREKVRSGKRKPISRARRSPLTANVSPLWPSTSGSISGFMTAFAVR